MKARSMRSLSGRSRRSGARPVRSSSVSAAGSSSRASGLPPVAPTRSSRTTAGRAPSSSARGVGVAQPGEPQLGQPVRVELPRVALARPDEHRDRIGLQAPGDEHERLGRRAVEPVRVVDDAQQRLRVGRRREQARDRHRDEEAVLHALGRQPEGAPQRGGSARRAARRRGRGAATAAGAARRRAARTRPRRRRPVSTRIPSARASACCSSAVLPIPASPRTTSVPLRDSLAASSRRLMASHSLSRPSSTVRLYAGLGGGTSDPLDSTRVPEPTIAA